MIFLKTHIFKDTINIIFYISNTVTSLNHIINYQTVLLYKICCDNNSVLHIRLYHAYLTLLNIITCVLAEVN